MARLGKVESTGCELAEMWRNAAVFLPHFAGCTCTGPHLTLDRDAIEADLLAYLAQTYREAGCASLARFVTVREDESPRTSFAAWLSSLDKAKLGTEDRLRLLGDLRSSLRSLDAAADGRNFICQ